MLVEYKEDFSNSFSCPKMPQEVVNYQPPISGYVQAEGILAAKGKLGLQCFRTSEELMPKPEADESLLHFAHCEKSLLQILHTH